MDKFFYKQFESLKALTGFNQWDQLNEMANAKDEINKVIDAMVEETKREPFNILKPGVVQRVIHDAMMNDGEFRGLNAKWVRRALNQFWGIHGESILQKHHEQNRKDIPLVELTPEQSAKVDQQINEFLAKLRAVAPPPKIKDAAKEGAEWKSELERKAVSTEIDPDRKPYTAETIAERNKRIRAMQEQAFRSRNPEATEEEVQLFMHQASRYEIPEPKGK